MLLGGWEVPGYTYTDLDRTAETDWRVAKLVRQYKSDGGQNSFDWKILLY